MEEKQLLIRTNQDLLEKVRGGRPGRQSPTVLPAPPGGRQRRAALPCWSGPGSRASRPGRSWLQPLGRAGEMI